MHFAHFRAGDVRELIQHAENSPDRWPILSDLFDPALRHDGRDPLTDDNIGMPSEADVDNSRIPAKLVLVGDDGIYLMSNGRPALTRPDDPDKPRIVYAAEANAEAMDPGDCHEAKRHIFGGDDGAESIDLDAAKALVEGVNDETYVALELTPEHIAISDSRLSAREATAHWADPGHKSRLR